jgi:hypothetical protein
VALCSQIGKNIDFGTLPEYRCVEMLVARTPFLAERTQLHFGGTKPLGENSMITMQEHERSTAKRWLNSQEAEA